MAKTFQSLVKAGTELAPLRRVRPHNISTATALAICAPLIIEDCVRGAPIYVRELALETGLNAPTLGAMLGCGSRKTGARLWDIARKSERKPRIIKACRQNATIMMEHLNMAGAVALQERLGMTESEIVEAIEKLPVATDDE